MTVMRELEILSFKTARSFETWLKKNHASCASGIWLCFAKKDAGLKSVSRQEALDLALCYGWIDGLTKSIDEQTYRMHYAPRRKRSVWSKINRQHALRLIDEGRMQAPGLQEIERAREDGRWEAAYDGARQSTVPPDLQAELDRYPEAKAFFLTLNAQNRYAILFRLQTATRAVTRQARLERFVAMLREGRTLHPSRPPT